MRPTVFALILLSAGLLLGCGTPEASETAAGTKDDQRVTALVEKTGGNWDSLSDQDKQELIQKLGQGNEQTARVSFAARSSKGGPPAPGRP
jgi:hypothetical protein